MNILGEIAGSVLKSFVGGGKGTDQQPQQRKPTTAEYFADLVRTGAALKSEVASLKPTTEEQGQEDLRRVMSALETEHFEQMARQGVPQKDEVKWIRSTLMPTKTYRPTSTTRRFARKA